MRGIKIGGKLFGRNGKEKRCSEIESCNCEMPDFEEICTDERMKDLLHRIGQAIDDWAADYHLEKIPKKIIFEQVLDFLNAIERNVKK